MTARPPIEDPGPGGDTETNVEDERSLDELLGELSIDHEGEQSWQMNKEEEQDARKAMRQANEALEEKARKDRETAEEDEKGARGESNVTDGETGDGDGKDRDGEDDEAAEYIEKALAEASLDERAAISSSSRASSHSSAGWTSDEYRRMMHCRRASNESDDMALPAAPTSAPSTPLAHRKSEDTTLLPSAPTFHPASLSPSPKSAHSGYTNDEIETWCIICSDDATLSCVQCDGELYCERCWLEGHRGVSAGSEERSHKARAFDKDKKKRKDVAAKKKVRVGAA